MILLSGFRRQDYNNSQLFIRQLQEIFAEYPPSVTEAVTSPLTGLQRHSNFPPVIGEIVKALDEERDKFVQRSLEHRERRIALEAPVDRSQRLDLAQLMSRTEAGRMYWERFDKSASYRKVPVWVRPINEIMRETGVTQEQLDKMPDAKQSTGPPPSSELMTSEDEQELAKKVG